TFASLVSCSNQAMPMPESWNSPVILCVLCALCVFICPIRRLKKHLIVDLSLYTVPSAFWMDHEKRRDAEDAVFAEISLFFRHCAGSKSKVSLNFPPCLTISSTRFA